MPPVYRQGMLPGSDILLRSRDPAQHAGAALARWQLVAICLAQPDCAQEGQLAPERSRRPRAQAFIPPTCKYTTEARVAYRDASH